MGLPSYATAEQIAAAIDVAHTAYQAPTLRRVALSASRSIDQRMHRRFFPLTETVTFTSPPSENPDRVQSAGFFLNRDLFTVNSVKQDGTTLTVADVDVYPTSHGPPYSWLGALGATMIVGGVWTFTNDTEPAGALAEALDTTETGVNVTDSSAVGIGDLLLVESEQMIVEAKTSLDTTENTTSSLTADMAVVAVPIDDGSTMAVGEIIIIDTERMLIVDIIGNTLTVKRAFDGTVLSSPNSGADVFAPRTLTVERGAVGTTAATHDDAKTLTRNVAPGPIIDLCIAEAITTYQQESSGYGRTIGSGDNTQEARGLGLENARHEAKHYRRLRQAAI